MPCGTLLCGFWRELQWRTRRDKGSFFLPGFIGVDADALADRAELAVLRVVIGPLNASINRVNPEAFRRNPRQEKGRSTWSVDFAIPQGFFGREASTPAVGADGDEDVVIVQGFFGQGCCEDDVHLAFLVSCVSSFHSWKVNPQPNRR